MVANILNLVLIVTNNIASWLDIIDYVTVIHWMLIPIQATFI